jgi:hypothetical protein
MMQITTDDGTGVYDTGLPDNPTGPREHGTDYTNIYTPKNTQSIWVLSPNN